jgi:positive regulator of sigma E activity
MNESDGVVVRLDGDFAWVRPASPGHACGACASRSGCAASGGLLDGAAAPKLLRLPNAIRARPGDAVVIRAADGVILRAIWRAYAVPLLLALGGAMLMLYLTGSEGAALAGMLLGLGGGFLALRRGRRPEAEPILTIAFKNTFQLR